MDAFEKMLENINSKQGADRQKEIDRLNDLCTCPDCPSYNNCAEQKRELLYCIVGKSPECIKDELGCICPDCPVAVEGDLTNLYYCTIGSEKEMREKQ